MSATYIIGGASGTQEERFFFRIVFFLFETQNVLPSEGHLQNSWGQWDTGRTENDFFRIAIVCF